MNTSCKDLTGKRFSRLLVQKITKERLHGAVVWKCLCDCGRSIKVTTGCLNNGSVKSCGCKRSEYLHSPKRTHGQYGTARYKMWNAAKKRAKKKGFPFSLSVQDIPEIPTHCPVLGFELTPSYGVGGMTYNSPTLDRIIPKHGYVKGNIHIISQRANVIKNDASAEEIRKVADYVWSLIKEDVL